MNKRIFAKRLRQNMTDAERVLWKHLRAHRLSGQKFRRQQPVGPYIVDFIHFGEKLIIECDGGQHNENRADRKRDAWLNQQGFKVLRFWNHDILNNTESVLTEILSLLPPSPLAGEGSGERGNQQEKE
ncbi:MAG: endonuclease domain-containing protein [Candidatus Thiodiazotropha weberae]|nr:endonuclease domain-containing protein [Candidatus Thiodiazotropha weberae]